MDSFDRDQIRDDTEMTHWYSGLAMANSQTPSQLFSHCPSSVGHEEKLRWKNFEI